MPGAVDMCIHNGIPSSCAPALLKPVIWLGETSSESGGKPLKTSPPTASIEPSTPHHTLCLIEWLGTGAVGEAWKGVFSDANSSAVLDVVAKVGRFAHSHKKLVDETKIYERLRRKNVSGVPVALGLFDDPDDEVTILLMTYAGKSVGKGIGNSLK